MQVQRERQRAELLIVALSRHAGTVEVVLSGDLIPVMTVDDASVRPDRDRHLHAVLADRLLKLRVLVRGKPMHDLIAAHDEAPIRIYINSGVRWNHSPCSRRVSKLRR